MSAQPCPEPRERRITASYGTLHEANAAAYLLGQRLGVDVQRVRVLGVLQRRERHEAPTAEPSWCDFVGSHLRAGARGVLFGLLLWAACYVTGAAAVASSPAASALAFGLVGMLIGVMLAIVLFALPPPADAARSASEGRWIVMISARSDEEERCVLALLGAAGGRTAIVRARRGQRRSGS